jgi:pimeloyl-ACP methyl ester carboxylesterase
LAIRVAEGRLHHDFHPDWSCHLNRLTITVSLLLTAGASAFYSPAAQAQWQTPPTVIPGVKYSYVPLGPGVPGVLYEPTDPGPKSHIALFVMHASGDYLTFSACSELSMRGYRVLCANNSSSKSGAFDDGNFDRVLLEAGMGIAYLRKYPGVEKIVLFGHSGGATVMTAYQAIAESGLKACQGPEKIHKCPDTLGSLPKADGVVLADANWGQAEMMLLSVDPAVVDDSSGTRLNAKLDMFSAANGYQKEGTRYSPEFVRRFLAAEGARNNRLIKKALDRLAAIEAGTGNYVDDEPFVIAGASFIGNRLFTEDPSLLSHSRNPWPLIHSDGSVTTEIIHSLRKSMGRQSPTSTYARGALKTTVKGYLSSYAIRVTPQFGYDASSVRGVEWTSTYASPPGTVESFTMPLLTLGMTGNWEGLAAEEIYLHAKSPDKSIAFVEGADHIYRPCKPCERVPGEFGDTVKTTYNYIDEWLGKPGRFLAASK